MTDETKKEGQKQVNSTELSTEDLQHVAGGTPDLAVNRAKAVNKTTESLEGYIKQ